MKTYELNDLIAAICPIDGIDSSGAIHFKPEALGEQRASAQALMDANLSAVSDVPTHNDSIWAQIHAMEAKELAPRMVRDLAKKSLSKDAADIGMTLDQVYALAVQLGDAAPEAAKGYKKFKDFDDSIAALKRQLR